MLRNISRSAGRRRKRERPTPPSIVYLLLECGTGFYGPLDTVDITMGEVCYEETDRGRDLRVRTFFPPWVYRGRRRVGRVQVCVQRVDGTILGIIFDVIPSKPDDVHPYRTLEPGDIIQVEQW